MFLSGAECPFTCSFCDLWRWTIDGPTPAGALVTQVEGVLRDLDGVVPDRLKLYNASNFFDRRAVPPEDVQGLAALATAFSSVTVESHARTIGAPVLDFARRIGGRLEVAMGLETIHPIAATALNKRLSLEVFDRAAEFLRTNDIDLRVFVLLGAPPLAGDESVAWTIRSAAYAVERGATRVSIIPVRGGNGEMERLQALKEFTPPTLSQLETALDECLALTNAAVTADLWDIGQLSGCAVCASERCARLQRLNDSGCAEKRIMCDACGTA